MNKPKKKIKFSKTAMKDNKSQGERILSEPRTGLGKMKSILAKAGETGRLSDQDLMYLNRFGPSASDSSGTSKSKKTALSKLLAKSESKGSTKARGAYQIK